MEEQGQLVETVRKRLKDWKPDSTFHEIVYKITSNLKMYEEYVNNYTKVSYLFLPLQIIQNRKNSSKIIL